MVLVVRVLRRGRRRFNASRPEIGAISQKVLAATRRDLEQSGFVIRTVTPATPPQVAYAFTAPGEDLLLPVRGLATWVLENAGRINAARDDYRVRTRATE